MINRKDKIALNMKKKENLDNTKNLKNISVEIICIQTKMTRF